MPGDSGFPAVDAGAVRWSIPRASVAKELSGRPLLAMLHGYGSHEHDLFGLSEYLPEDYVVASIRGLIPASAGFAWFPLEWNPDTNELTRDVNAANEACRVLLTWFEEVDREVRGLASTTLLGFSQGGAMAIQLMRHEPTRFDAAVVLAGFAIPDDSAGHAQRDARLAQENIPVLWGRDPHDPVITPELISYTRRWLPEHVNLTARLYAHVGHGISMEQVHDVREFLMRPDELGE